SVTDQKGWGGLNSSLSNRCRVRIGPLSPGSTEGGRIGSVSPNNRIPLDPSSSSLLSVRGRRLQGAVAGGRWGEGGGLRRGRRMAPWRPAGGCIEGVADLVTGCRLRGWPARRRLSGEAVGWAGPWIVGGQTCRGWRGRRSSLLKACWAPRGRTGLL